MKYYTNIDLNQNELLNSVIHKYAGNPNTGSVPGVDGQILWDSVGKALYSHNGTQWIASGSTYTHPNHSGDVTSVGDGAQTIANSAVTNAKMANMPQTTIKGRKTGSIGAPEDLTAAEVRTLINVADGANAYVHPNHSGDVTSTGDGATVIANNAVTLAKLATQAANSFLANATIGVAVPSAVTVAEQTLVGRITGGNIDDLSTTQVRTLLNVADGANAYSHPNHSGDVTSVADGAQTITNKAVTLAKMADIATSSILGRKTALSGVPEVLSKSDVLTLLNVADGAQVNQTITSGNGMNFTSGNGNITITLGTPTALTAATTDAVSTNGHSHSIETAIAVSLSNASANAIGVSTSLSRADHTHAITGFALSSHTHAYDNYGSWTLKANTEVTGITVGSGDVVDIIGGTNVTVVRGTRTLTINSTDTNTTYSVFTTTTNGLVPMSVTSNTTDYLRRDGTWATPPDNNTIYTHPNHSGDVTSVADGATTIVNGAVTLAKMANMATASLIYRKTAGAGAPEVNTLATLKTDLLLTKTDVGLANVTNDAQVKKLATSTIGNVPVWSVTTGDALGSGYGIETTLTGSASNLARADAVKTYVDALLGANKAMIFKGTVGGVTGGTQLSIVDFNALTTYTAGWTYSIVEAGTIKGNVCEIGDTIMATVTRTGTGNVNADWLVTQGNVDGVVIGPVSAVSGNFASFNATTGKLIQDSGSKASDFATSAHTHTNMTFKKTFDVGGSTTIVLTHNLGTRDVSVTLRRVASPYDVVYADIELTTIDTTTIRFAVAPSAAEYRATIIG